MSSARASLVVLTGAITLGCSSTPAAPSRGADGGLAAVIDSGHGLVAEDAGPVAMVIPLPAGAPGIGFDDLRWAPRLGKVLTPGGRSGNLDLVDPTTLAVAKVAGFSVSGTFAAGSHAAGTTSADEGPGVIFAIDHETTSVRVVDEGTSAIVATAPAAADPDYVRYVAQTDEIWLSQPFTGIEVLSVHAAVAPTHAATIPVTGGPEALVVDGKRGMVYTNAFGGKTYAVNVADRAVAETWSNGCALSLGLALDEARGFLFVACAAGTVVVLDVTKGGAKLGELAQGSGLDVLSYDPTLHHLYVQGSGSADLGIVGVSPEGVPALLGTVTTAAASTSVTDERGHVFVADPAAGGLIRVRDTYPRTE